MFFEKFFSCFVLIIKGISFTHTETIFIHMKTILNKGKWVVYSPFCSSRCHFELATTLTQERGYLTTLLGPFPFHIFFKESLITLLAFPRLVCMPMLQRIMQLMNVLFFSCPLSINIL